MGVSSGTNSFAKEMVIRKRIGNMFRSAMIGGALVQPWPTGMVPQMQLVPMGSGPVVPEDEETHKLRAERGRRAGDWTVELSQRGAFEEAYNMWI